MPDLCSGRPFALHRSCRYPLSFFFSSDEYLNISDGAVQDLGIHRVPAAASPRPIFFPLNSVLPLVDCSRLGKDLLWRSPGLLDADPLLMRPFSLISFFSLHANSPPFVRFFASAQPSEDFLSVDPSSLCALGFLTKLTSQPLCLILHPSDSPPLSSPLLALIFFFVLL